VQTGADLARFRRISLAGNSMKATVGLFTQRNSPQANEGNQIKQPDIGKKILPTKSSGCRAFVAEQDLYAWNRGVGASQRCASPAPLGVYRSPAWGASTHREYHPPVLRSFAFAGGPTACSRSVFNVGGNLASGAVHTPRPPKSNPWAPAARPLPPATRKSVFSATLRLVGEPDFKE